MRHAITAILCCGAALVCDGFAVRRTMTMKRRLLSEGKKKKNKARKVTLTKVPGITAPENGKLKGWSLDVGEGSVQFCAATLNIGGRNTNPVIHVFFCQVERWI